MKENPITRRQALAMMGCCSALTPFVGNPVNTLISGIAEGIIRKAHAAEGPGPRNYIYIYLHGGPNRWVFDYLLAPYSMPSSLVKHPYVNTCISNGKLAYQTFPFTVNGVTLNLPTLWKCSLPRLDGTSVPMTSLLANMFTMRGVNMEIEGHGRNSERQLRPSSSAPSLQGAVADHSDRPIPSVSLWGTLPNHVYRSEKGMGLVSPIWDPARKHNPLLPILGPFNGTNTNPVHYPRRDALDKAVNAAMESLARYTKSRNPGAEKLFDLRHRVDGLIRKGIGNAEDVYPAARDKYLQLIDACVTTTIPEVSNAPVPWNIAGESGAMFAPGKIARNPDLRTMLTREVTIGLAEGFAASEYLLRQGYTSSVMFGSAGVGPLFFENTRDINKKIDEGNVRSGSLLDAHYTGSALTLLIDSFFFRALATCLYEFITQLKAAGLFDETIIQLGSEFGRIPRENMDGSDHGWSASNATLFSGAIKRPLILGNISRNATGNETVQLQAGVGKGTWGTCAKVSVDGHSRYLHIGHVTSTLCHLLRIPRLMTNYSSLVQEGSQGLTPTIEFAALKETQG